MMLSIEKRVAQTAKRAGFLTGSLLLCAIGVGFLTAAIWLALASSLGAQTATFIVAFAYLGAGCILMALGRTAPSEERKKTASENGPPVMQAFLYGLQAGAQSGQARR